MLVSISLLIVLLMILFITVILSCYFSYRILVLTKLNEDLFVYLVEKKDKVFDLLQEVELTEEQSLKLTRGLMKIWKDER